MKSQNKKYKPRTKRWFINRIGKRIFRDEANCCKICSATAEVGIIVTDKIHAEYMADIDSSFAYDEVYLNYRDKK